MGGSVRWRMAAGVGAAAAIAAVGVSWPLTVHAAGASVSMKEDTPGCPSSGYCFTPSATSITTGNAVTWTNQTDASHTVTRCTASACNGVGPGTGTGSGPGSSQISAGKSFSMTFNGAGTYTYYCTVHGYAVMHGTVTVSAASSSGSSSSSGAVTTPATGADPGWVPAGALVTAGAAMLGGALVVRRRRPNG